MVQTMKKAAAENVPYAFRNYSPEQLREVLHKMHLIRRFEEGAEDAYTRGLIHGTMHLSIGQEGAAVGATMALRNSDYITSTRRGHGHFIGKGADPKLMFAEFFGKEEGYCRGRGGSMHIADVATGNLGANGIVGGGLPIAVGAALAIKKQKRDDVAMCFFGDGASNEGTFHEGINMASNWKLPVIFLCENNGYAVSTPISTTAAVADIADRAAAYAIPGIVVDGQDIITVYEVVTEAVRRARAGEGPTLVEAKTYRYLDHAANLGRDLGYRTNDEIEGWRQRDPIALFAKRMTTDFKIAAAELAAIDDEVTKEVNHSLDFARNSPFPDAAEAFADVYGDRLADAE